MMRRSLTIIGAGIILLVLFIAIQFIDTGRQPSIEASVMPPEETDLPESAADPEADEPAAGAAERPTSLLEQLERQLAAMREPVDSLPAWIADSAREYGAESETMAVAEADFDQDGMNNEWVTVISEEKRDDSSNEVIGRAAYGVYIAYREHGYELQSSIIPEADQGGARVAALGDLTGDGRPEVVWEAYMSGAHTLTSAFSVSEWSDGRLTRLPGAIEIASVEQAEIANNRLIVTGGLIGSAGAGTWQRVYTDTYAVEEDAIRHIDRLFAESPTAYHYLMDGLWAEAFGEEERALRAYEAAAAAQGGAYEPYAFEYGGQWTEGGANPEAEAAFERVVQQYAGMRRQLLADKSQHDTPQAACAAAKREAGYEDDWLEHLNAPAGYANYKWNPETVCASIHELDR